jgi:hypothetical protein
VRLLQRSMILFSRPQCGADCALMLRPGGERGPLRRRQSGKAVPFPGLLPIDLLLCRHPSGGIAMNTAMARRLALGDRVVWIGDDGCPPTSPGTITRITAHEIEVRWDGETVRRYRRAHLHNLRHEKLF